MPITEKQREKAHIFDNEKLDGLQMVVKKMMVRLVPNGRSADYYEGYYDAMEKVASIGLDMITKKPNVTLEHLLAGMPFMAMAVSDKLAELDEEAKEEDPWPSELVEQVM